MTVMKFGNVDETVITQDEFSLDKARKVLANEVIAMIGYGVQGPAQALNLKDNGIPVIIGQRPNSSSWDKAIEDGFKPGETLFDIEEACAKGTFICYLLSDAAQMQCWSKVKPHLTKGKTLCFSHGFSVAYQETTGVVPPTDIDVVLVAPKGSGRSVRNLFLKGRGINSSYAIYQDASGHAEEKVLAFGRAIGSGYLFKTTFDHEVTSDLFGERGVLMGALAGIIAAQYKILRQHGHSPSEAFNETVEELTQSLVPLVGENGMDWMFQNCSTTAQRGALDWKGKFEAAVTPVLKDLYESVASGKEAVIVISENGREDYKQRLRAELDELHNEEVWTVGRMVRQLRPSEN